jgi:hypothetical protein
LFKPNEAIHVLESFLFKSSLGLNKKFSISCII